MKKIFIVITACLMMFSLTACGTSNAPSETESQTESMASTSETESQTESTASTPEAESQTESVTAKQEEESGSETENIDGGALIVYFSWSGNTEAIANEIQSQTGADIFELVPTSAYTDDYNTLLDIAQGEQSSNVRPAISASIENMEDYDVIYVGFPNWWGDMPMILYTFFDSYDLSGKTILPFCSSGGSGFSNTISEIKSLEPEATVLGGLHIRESQLENAKSNVNEWLTSSGMID